MIKITLDSTWANKGQFYQTWIINGEEYRTVSEWDDVQYLTNNYAAILGPGIIAEDVITLAIHGYGPTIDGETTEWDLESLQKRLKEGGYIHEPA